MIKAKDTYVILWASGCEYGKFYDESTYEQALEVLAELYPYDIITYEGYAIIDDGDYDEN